MSRFAIPPGRREPPAPPRLLSLLVLCILGMGAAYAHADGLEAWLEGQLLPYLQQRFGKHPRLAGEPFEVRAVRDGTVVARTNELTLDLVERISDALDAQPGANLVRDRPRQLWIAPPALEDLRCPPTQPARVRLTVEVTEAARQRGRVVVKAINLDEAAPVAGVSKRWAGRLTRDEQARLQRERVKRTLRGSRALPYRSDQPDLVSAQLAVHVGCVLRRQGAGPHRVYVAPPDGGSPAAFDRVARLLRHYLAAIDGIEIVGASETSDTTITLQAHAVDDERYQLWTSIGNEPTDSLVHPAFPVYVARPTAQNTQRDPSTARNAAPEPSTMPDRQPLADTAGALIETFELIAPAEQASCNRARPWANGEAILHADDRLQHGGCFAIRYTAAAEALLYLFAQTGNGEVRRLLPNACEALNLGSNTARAPAGERLHIPLFRDGSRGYFRLDGEPGIERILAVAVDVRAPGPSLQALVRRTRDPCEREGSSEARTPRSEFRAAMREVLRQNAGNIEWAARSLIHVERR